MLDMSFSFFTNFFFGGAQNLSLPPGASYPRYATASNAFDRVNHWKLFNKLIIRKVPLLIVRMLIFWYSNQEMCIKWGQSTSCFFTVSNGVRQGGILSPRLFAVYVDDLSK